MVKYGNFDTLFSESYGDCIENIAKNGNLTLWIKNCLSESEQNAIDVAFRENGIGFLLNESLSDKAVHADKKASGVIDNFISKSAEVAKKIVIGNERDDIIENRIKASKVIKELVVYGGIGIFNPALALLAWLSKTALKVKLSKAEKEKILFELKTDLEVLDEKIADAGSSNDRKKKYELMRLRNETKKTIERIKIAPIATKIG